METIYPKYSHIIKWNTQPHLAHLDHTRHKFGISNEKVNDAFEKYDEWIGRFIEALDKAGVYEETNFIILGDHGQIDIKNVIATNIIFKDKGFIDVNKNGNLIDYKYSIATHGHLSHKGDKPPFIAKGPNVKKDIIIDGGNLVDEAPTIMKLFGIEMKNIDGKLLDILKEFEYAR